MQDVHDLKGRVSLVGHNIWWEISIYLLWYYIGDTEIYWLVSTYSTPSTSAPTSSSVVTRLTRRVALPRIRMRESLWKRCRTSICSSSPRWRASTDPSFLICSAATLCQPPSVSAATGMKAIPSCLQASPTFAIFQS